MEDPDFTLICSNGDRLPVNKAKLGAASEVFGDMFSTVNDGAEQECEVSESGEDMKALLMTLEKGGIGKMSAKELGVLVTLSLKYALDRMVLDIKLRLWKLIVDEQNRKVPSSMRNLVLYELAAKLDDEELAQHAIYVTLNFERALDGMRSIDQKWRDRALMYGIKWRLSLHQTLAEMVMKNSDRLCTAQHASDTNDYLHEAAMEIQKLPYLSAKELFDRQLNVVSRVDCIKCVREQFLVCESLNEQWPYVEARLRAAF